MAANESDLATLDDPAQSSTQTARGDTIYNPPYRGPDVIENPPYRGPDVIENPHLHEPFVPSRADRPYHQWSKPDWILQGAMNTPGLYPGPLMPQIRDFAGLIHSAVMGLGRFGSHYTGMPAIAMGTYANAYWTAYQKGMKERASDAYQQYRMARQMTIDRGKEENEEYAKIYAKYYDEKGNVADPDGFHHELLAAAHKYQNKYIINAIESGHPEQADRIIQMTDSHIMNLIKAQHQEEQQKLLDEERRLRIKKMEEGEQLPPDWGGSGSGTSPSQPESSDPDTDDTKDDDTKSDESKTDDESPIQTAELGTSDIAPSVPRTSLQGTPQRAQAPPTTPRVATPEEVNRRIDDIARGELRGEAVDKGVPKQILPRIAARKADLERELNGIVDSGATGQDMLNKLHTFDPELAKTVEDIVHGRRVVPSSGGFGAALSAGWNRLTSLAEAVRPGWGPEVATFRREFVNPNGFTQKQLKAASSLTGAAKKVMEALQYIPENASPPENWFSQLISGTITGSPEWKRLGSALNSYAEESAKLARGGQSAEGDIQRVLSKYATTTAGPKSIRALLANEAGVAVSQIQSNLDDWQSITQENTPAPGYNDKAMQELQTLDHLDMMTGNILPRGTFIPDSLKPLIGPAGSKVGELSQDGAQEGDRKQFKQGWGVFRNGKWVPE